MDRTVDPPVLHTLDDRELDARLARETPDRRWRLVRTLREEAARFYNSDAAHARRIAERALSIARALRDPLALGWAHRTRAEALLYSGHMLDSEREYEEAVSNARAARDDGLRGQLLVGRIHVLSLLGRHRDARACAREARRLLEEAGDETYLAKLSVSLGNLHFQRDEHAEALVEYERASQLFDKGGVRDATVLGLETNRAVALTQLDRDEEALALFHAVERETGEQGLELLRAQVRMNAAYVYSQRAQFDEALRLLPLATTYFRETDHPAFLASCLLNRAEVYHQLNLRTEARDLADEAATCFERERLTYDHALALLQSAATGLALGERREALRRIKQSLKLFQAEKNAPRVALMKLLWGEALFESNRYDAAGKKAAEAAEAFRTLGLTRWEAAAAVLNNSIARRRFGADLTVEARSLQKLLRKVPRDLYPFQVYRLLAALGETLEQSERPARARTVYEKALGSLEALRTRVPTEDSKIAFLEGKTHLYDRLLALELRRGRPSGDLLFQWSERARAQSLWDRLRAPREGAVNHTSPELEAERRHLSWLHSRLSRLELGTDEERRRARTLRPRVLEAERRWTRLRRETEETEAPHRSTRAREAVAGDAGVDLGAIQSALAPGTALASYHLGPDFAFVSVVTRETLVWRELVPDLRTRVQDLTDRLDFQWGAAAMLSSRSGLAGDVRGPKMATSATLTLPHTHGTRSGAATTPSEPTPNGDGPGSETPGSSRFRMLQRTTDQILRDLHRLLWAPLEELDLPHVTRWIVSPHGPIHRVPMHALLDGRGYLAERAVVTVTPSARVWYETRPRAGEHEKTRRTAWIGGIPSPQLPAVEREVERVEQHLRRWSVTRDERPTREAFRARAPQADLVHLAAHGSLRRDNPVFSFVQLVDGPLFVHDLQELSFRRSTIVLTACSSGRGFAPAGDEWIGMARGFLNAGASAVIASLWPIQDQSTLELIDAFYERYTRENDAPEALRQAMCEQMRNRPHPWHWASFSAIGGVC